MVTPSPLGAAARLIDDVRHRVGRRFAGVAVLAVAAAAAEGVGILLLLPLLGLLGVTGDGGAANLPWLHEAGRRLGLEGALAVYLALIAGAALVVWGRSVASSALVLDYAEDLRRRLHGALMEMEWEEVGTRRRADMTLALTGETSRCAVAVTQLLQMLAAAFQLPALLLAAGVLSPGFTVATVGLAVLMALAVRPLSRRSYVIGQMLGEASRAFHADLSDRVAGLRILKTFNPSADYADPMWTLAAEVRRRQLAQQRAAATARAVQRVASAMAAALALWAGLRLLSLPLADLLVLLALFARLMPAALQVQECWRVILQQLPTHTRLMADLDVWRRAAEPEAAPAPPRLTRALELSGVGYRHPMREEAGKAALQDISGTLPAFKTTAVVGPSGAGKSTLADVVMGLLVPDAGEIRIDGMTLDGPKRIAWRRSVGYAPQDPFLFHRSIRDNLTIARPDATEQDLWAALETAGAAEMVRALPARLDAPVGDHGSRLSGGERQRIALARALLRHPDLLILDEATSALDAETEGLIAESLRRVHGTCTILVIAHRPSTVRDADHVLLLEAGRLVAQGSWDQVRAAAPERLAALDMEGAG